MDKNEIVRKYKRLKMLFLLPVPLFLVFVIFDLLCRSDLYRVLDDIMLAIVIFPFLYFMIHFNCEIKYNIKSYKTHWIFKFTIYFKGDFQYELRIKTF